MARDEDILPTEGWFEESGEIEEDGVPAYL